MSDLVPLAIVIGMFGDPCLNVTLACFLLALFHYVVIRAHIVGHCTDNYTKKYTV